MLAAIGVLVGVKQALASPQGGKAAGKDARLHAQTVSTRQPDRNNRP
jgi:hypothetical protein